MTVAVTPALLVELRHAASIIHNALTGRRAANPAALAAAHDTLHQRRRETSGPIRDAIDHYLHHDTWQHGPHTLRQAAQRLATSLGVAKAEEPRHSVGEQLQLFQLPEHPPSPPPLGPMTNT